MLIGLNENEGCTVTINHSDALKSHSVVISNFGDGNLHVREFNPPTTNNSDYVKCSGTACRSSQPFEHTYCSECGTKL